MNSLIVVAAGMGSRMGASVNKLLLEHDGRSLIYYTLCHVLQSRLMGELIVVVKEKERQVFEEILRDLSPKIPVKLAEGGRTRLESVRHGISALSVNSCKVLVHDGARPFVDGQTIDEAFEAITEETPAVVVAIPCVDTIKEVEDGKVCTTPDRSRLYRAQTPQGAFSDLMKRALADLSSEDGITDDASILERAGIPVKILLGREDFFKVTTPGDWSRFVQMTEKNELPFRIGQGYDIHQFDENRPLFLGGVRIAEKGGLLGHSDADVLLHAIMDALLGAAGLMDIGHYFPDTDEKFAGADSKKLLLEVKNLLDKEGYGIGNIDSTVIAEKPKLSPYISEMKASIADVLELSPSQVGVKATTNEKLGAVGRREGMAALASVIIFKRK